MSTLSGVFPNAITPTYVAAEDPAQQVRARNENESAVFAPVEELEQTSSSRASTIEQPGRLEAESVVNSASQPPPATDEVEGDEVSNQSSTSTNASEGDDQDVVSEEQRKLKADAEDEKLKADIDTIRELATRDREVKAHEQAHQSVGGQYAGAMEFSYTQGPDGKRYAVAGEVGIDVSKVANDPEATLRKADQVRRAALAPAEPSTQDRQVAAQASQMSIEAQTDILQMERQLAEKTVDERAEQGDFQSEDTSKVEASSKDSNKRTEEASDTNKERLENIFESSSDANESALDAAYQINQRQEVGFNLDTTV